VWKKTQDQVFILDGMGIKAGRLGGWEDWDKGDR